MSKVANNESNIVPSKDDPTFIACPPTKEKAMEDDGRFFERMSKENRFFSGNSNYKKNWEICFDARNPSLKNHGQQCCYSTELGQLLLGHEDKGGSFAKMHHDADIPYISHYIYDILPFYDCCIRSNKYCKLYYTKRPSDNGKRYQPPRPAITFGEPHMVTLDGVQYTFNGCGEFIILKTSNNKFMLQGRMEQLNMINGTSINATVYTAFAMKSNISDTVQIQLNEFGGMDDVLVESDKKDFDNEETILFSNGLVQKKPNMTKYVVFFANGIAVTVEGARQLLQLMVKVPDQHLGKTSGLLGYFDNDKEKEFLLPNGTFLKTSSKATTLHYEFGLKWAVDANQSLFTYFGAKNHSFFQKPIFVPLLFDYDNLTFTDANLEAESRRICQGNIQCLIDAIATGQPSFALMSRNITNEFKQTLSILTRRIDCIPLFPEFAFGKMQRTDLEKGEVNYAFKCNPNFVLDGSDRISCKNGKWNGTKPRCRGCSPVFKNVTVDSVTLTDLDEVTYRFSCKQGYQLLGPNIVICKGGEWNKNKTACLKDLKAKANAPKEDYTIAIGIGISLGIVFAIGASVWYAKKVRVSRNETVTKSCQGKTVRGERENNAIALSNLDIQDIASYQQGY